MTFTEMVQSYANACGISYDEALSEFPVQARSSTATYRTLTTYVEVTSTYKPHFEYYCETSESGHYWGITRFVKVRLVADYNDTTMTFTGTATSTLLNGYQISWSINGTFYTGGVMHVTSADGDWDGYGDTITIIYQAASYTSLYTPYDKSGTKSFQS